MKNEEAFTKIGNTPIVELKNIEKALGLRSKIFAKLEMHNLTGSIKDRTALFMIKDSEEKGLLKEGSTIIEPTSGNTGIGLACIGALCGYQVILTMPDSMSIERRQLLEKYGAKVVLTPGALGMNGSVEKARELNGTIPNSVILGQFDNPANVKAHYETTGPEIYQDLEGDIDAFVAGIGTGGTLTGAGRFLKEKKENIQVIGVEPLSSPLLASGEAGSHKIQGIGANFVPKILDVNLYDELIHCSDDDAFKYGKMIRKLENISVGISSGAALFAAVTLALRKEYEGKNIVVVFPDSGDRYLSTPLFDGD